MNGCEMNPSFKRFLEDKNKEIYVDKSEILNVFDTHRGTSSRDYCISRPEKWGATTLLNMTEAFFSRGYDSTNLFQDMKIANIEGSFNNINNFDVFRIDIKKVYENDPVSFKKNAVFYIDSVLIKELEKHYKEFTFDYDDDFLFNYNKVYTKYNNRKVILLVDNFDYPVRAELKEEVVKRYYDWAGLTFKHSMCTYVKKFSIISCVHSLRRRYREKCNDIEQQSITNDYFFYNALGYTSEEVLALCNKYNMNYQEIKEMYGGYSVDRQKDVFNPYSVNKCLINHKIDYYWVNDINYKNKWVEDFIKKNKDGKVQKVLKDIYEGKRVSTWGRLDYEGSRSEFNITDEILIYLVERGFLACESVERNHIFYIPNKEIKYLWDKVKKELKI